MPDDFFCMKLRVVFVWIIEFYLTVFEYIYLCPLHSALWFSYRPSLYIYIYIYICIYIYIYICNISTNKLNRQFSKWKFQDHLESSGCTNMNQNDNTDFFLANYVNKHLINVA